MTLRKEVLAFIKKEYGVEAECPWARYPENEVFRHEDNKKWFALIMPVGKKHLGMGDEGYVDIINVKLDSMLIDMLRQQEGFLPAYHMNKKHWISVRLDARWESGELEMLLENSHQLSD